jgi:hypothetical protein
MSSGDENAASASVAAWSILPVFCVEIPLGRELRKCPLLRKASARLQTPHPVGVACDVMLAASRSAGEVE